VQRILLAQQQRTYDAKTKGQQSTQMLAQLRRQIDCLRADDIQQWPATNESDEVCDVEVIELDKVRALLDRKDCGGEVL
jgi:hypothetical protein